MRKNIFSCFCFLLLSSASFAQISKDSLLKIMARETCEEISKKDFSKKNMDEIQLELGLAMMPVVAKYQDELKTVFGFDLDDQKGLENMGKEVGMQLAKDCPAFLKMFMNNPDAVKEISGKNKDVSTSQISGTLIKIVAGDFSYVQVRDNSNGKIEKLWWMEYFEGSNKFSTDPQKQLNKPIKVNYVEKEVYNATLKDYVKIKVITGIE